MFIFFSAGELDALASVLLMSKTFADLWSFFFQWPSRVMIYFGGFIYFAWWSFFFQWPSCEINKAAFNYIISCPLQAMHGRSSRQEMSLGRELYIIAIVYMSSFFRKMKSHRLITKWCSMYATLRRDSNYTTFYQHPFVGPSRILPSLWSGENCREFCLL